MLPVATEVNQLDDLFLKLIQTLGAPGLTIWCAYKLLDRWAPQFLAAHKQQAEAMAVLAEAVKSGQDGQKEVLLAVRVLAQKVDESTGWLKELSEHMKVGASPS